MISSPVPDSACLGFVQCSEWKGERDFNRGASWWSVTETLKCKLCQGDKAQTVKNISVNCGKKSIESIVHFAEEKVLKFYLVSSQF